MTVPTRREPNADPSLRAPETLTVPQRTQRVEAADLYVKNLGPCRYESPIKERLGQRALHHVGQAERVLLDDRLSEVAGNDAPVSERATFELAGPRDRLFFDPKTLRAGIVTCGGLCPGINNVVRGLVLELTHAYGVTEIFGFRYGFEGLVAHEPLRLVPRLVRDIHQQGGTILGTSRGSQEPARMVDTLERLGIGALFVIGGDGTLRGATKILAEAERRKLSLAIVGIPKTIDNDIHFIDRSFGFESAFAAAVEAIRSAHVEATGARNGIGLVKLMGRHSGFIACHAALASTDVNFVLIPEVPLRLDGDGGLLRHLEERLAERGHAVIVVAEGAGQDLCVDPTERPTERTTERPQVRTSQISALGSGSASAASKSGSAPASVASASAPAASGASSPASAATNHGSGPIVAWAGESPPPPRTDASGNVRLKDIGMVLRDRINQHFDSKGTQITLKYIDPSYQIRSVPASPADSVYCWNLARNAVHAAMAGNTEMLIGRWHGRFVHVPLPLATRFRKQVDVNEDLWMSVIESTGQPVGFG